MTAWLLALVLQAGVAPVSPSADLVLFVAPGSSDLGREFQDEVLPRVRASAERASMTLRVLNIAEGAPPEVTITPLLVHQSTRGRSVYQGRSNNLERIEAFMRTSRFVSQDGEPWLRTNLPVQRIGRALIAAPCKITELSGEVPEGHDAAAFEGRARAAIHAGFRSFSVEPSVEFRRGDRAFYLDFYPHAADGQLYVSMALFSMFHCKEALWTTDVAVSGPFAELEEVFQRAAIMGEEAIALERATSRTGDGFDPVPEEVPVRAWEALGLALPAATARRSVPEGEAPSGRIEDLPLSWRFALGEGDPEEEATTSGLRFHFAPPLDGTAGEVARAQGSLHFEEAGKLESATGEVRCQTASVSLGWEDLDATVHGESMLDIDRYPEASFVLRELRAQSEGGQALVWGRPTGFLGSGTFTMKGRELPIEVRGNLEPVLHESGTPRLLVDGAFSLRLKGPFGITGPDGPSPAKDTLQFELSLLLVPGAEPEDR